MRNLINTIKKCFQNHYRDMILAIFTGLILVMGYYATKITFDISPDAIALKKDLQSSAYQKANLYFNDDEQLFIIINDIKPFESLKSIDALVKEIEGINLVSGVYAITNLPLLFSPRIELFHLMFAIPTIQSPDTDLNLAKKELTNGLYYKKLFLNSDQTLTSILINIKPPSKESIRINQTYAHLAYEQTQRKLSSSEKQTLHKLKQIDLQNKLKRNEQLSDLITNIKTTLAKFKQFKDVYIVGLSAISQTIVDYLKADLFHFGISAFILMSLFLCFVFKRFTDACIALVSSLVVVVLSIGLFSYLNWPLTIASANTPPILFVVSLTFIIYLILRFQEVTHRHPKASKLEIIHISTQELKTPIAYSCLTTMVGFLSLTLCNIQPIIDFGIMMSTGIPIAFLVCFLLIPNLESCFKKTVATKRTQTWPKTFILISQQYKKSVLLSTTLILVMFCWGIQYITVENRFVDYFTSNTNMVKSIHLIDEELAGTSTLDILLEYPQKNYWLEKEGLMQIRQLEHFLIKQPGVTKVLSIDSIVQLLEQVQGEALSPKLLKFTINGIPKAEKEVLTTPYIAKNGELTRVVVYLPDSDPALKRDELINNINVYLDNNITPNASHEITGLYWLYNNVLQSLLKAQINILLSVYSIISLILLILFRNVKLVLCALIPNIIPLCVVFGTLGWLGISLDFMTMTIAGISLGLAIDFAIQFIYRFKKEINNHTFNEALLITYNSIGYAIVTTTLTLIIGFSVMLLSHFKPLVYFSLLSGLSIGVACLSTLLILPILLQFFIKKQSQL